MVRLWKTTILAGATLLLATAVWAQQQTARPGTVNYTEGQVYQGSQLITPAQNGHTEIALGEVLSTQDGKAEMLLTPGVFLRLDDHSAVKLLNESLSNIRVELIKGKAMVEADQVEKENHLAVVQGGATTVLKKKGIYEFNADKPAVAVYKGVAAVTQDDRTEEVYKGQRMALVQNPKLKTHGFNRKREDDLYDWSKLRSEYISQANMSMAQTIVDSPWAWYGAGWYWDPWFDSWAFMPGFGWGYSPFGFGFYSPGYWGAYGGYGGFYRPGYGYAGRGFGRGGFGRGGFGGRPMGGGMMRGGGMMHGGMGGGFGHGGGRR